MEINWQGNAAIASMTKRILASVVAHFRLLITNNFHFSQVSTKLLFQHWITISIEIFFKLTLFSHFFFKFCFPLSTKLPTIFKKHRDFWCMKGVLVCRETFLKKYCHHQAEETSSTNVTKVFFCSLFRGGIYSNQESDRQRVKLHCEFFPLELFFLFVIWWTGKNISSITIKHDICLLLVWLGYLYRKLFILISVLVF